MADQYATTNTAAHMSNRTTSAHGGMHWRGEYDPGREEGYDQNDVVREGGFTMISLADDNEEYPAPQPIGEPFYVREIPGTPPAWTTEDQTSKALFLIQEYTFPDAAYVLSTLFYIPGGNIGLEAEMWSVRDPYGTPDFRVLIPSFIVDEDDDDSWVEVPLGATIVPQGETFHIVLILRSKTGETTWAADWDAKRKNDTDVSSGEAWHGSGSQGTRIHYTDADDNDQQAPLQALAAGDEYEVNNVRYTITEKSNESSHLWVHHEPTSRPQENEYTYVFYTYSTLPINYVRVPGWYFAQPNIKGAIATVYDPDGLTLTDDLVGVDLKVQQMSQPDNWDLVAYSGL